MSDFPEYAYPAEIFDKTPKGPMPQRGMTLRDWFAGSLDIGNIQFSDLASAADWMGIDQPDETDFIAMLEFTFKLDAFIRYKKADAMLAARAKGGAE